MSRISDREDVLFAEALALPPAQREAFLAAQCGADLVLRARLVALLAAHEAPESLSGPHVTDLAAARRAQADLSAVLSAEGLAKVEDLAQAEEKPGDTIGLPAEGLAKAGRYKLLQKIGEGGCGVVWMAEQEAPVRRRVAVKVVKLGMDTRAVVARFEAERQALALMDHPNIAKVFDAGVTATGRPFFVMELVRGIPITRFCDDHALGLRERLQLFIQVCHAIQHAHQKGIIHRDIKPSNVLVSQPDDVPVPVVIDFGIAKATAGRLAECTFFTGFDQFVGTPAYMAPEQADFNAVDVDTRSDVYSLGVLLYELLAGRPPFDPRTLARSSLGQIRKVICEQEPLRPSVRLRTLPGEERTTIASRRGVPPAQLPRLLGGDLDWIAMKALEKSPSRRYQTANALAVDVQRFLALEPVAARPPTLAYRLGRQIARRRLAWSAGGLVLAALVSGFVFSTVSWRREIAARGRAEGAESAAREATALAAAARLNAERMLVFAVADLGEQLDEMGQQPLLRKVAGEVLGYYEQLDPRLQTRETRAGHALAKAGLSTAGWLSIGRSSEFRLGELRARERLEEALDEMSSLEATGPLTPFMRVAYVGVLWGMTGQCYREGRPEAGIALLDRVEKLLEPVLTDARWDAWAERFMVRLLVGKGAVRQSANRYGSDPGLQWAAVAEYNRALLRAERICCANPTDRSVRLLAIDGRVRLSRALAAADPAWRREAIGINASAQADAEALVAQQPFLVGARTLRALAVRNQAALIRPDWRFSESGAGLDDAIAALGDVLKHDPELGSGHTFLPDTLVIRAEHHWALGRFTAAEADLRTAIGMWNHPAEPPNALLLLMRGYETLARVYASTGRDREADDQLALADAVFARVLAGRPWLGAAGRANLEVQRDVRRAAVEYQRLNWPALREIALRIEASLAARASGGGGADGSGPASVRAQFLTAALELDDATMVQRYVGLAESAAPAETAAVSLQDRFSRLRGRLDRLEAEVRTGAADAARLDLGALWPEVEAVYAAGPEHLFNQVQTARALLLRAELVGTTVERRAWLDRAAGLLRPAVADGRLTRAERELVFARVEKGRATLGELSPLLPPSRERGRNELEQSTDQTPPK